MNNFNPLSDRQTQTISAFLESESVSDGCLDFIAMHGFLTGIAAGPESLNESDWLSFIFDATPEYHSSEQEAEIETLINQLAVFIQRTLYLDEELDIPCPMTAAKPGNSNQLSDWCFGFLEAISLDEERWFSDPELTDSVAELILPVAILSNQMVAPELEHLTTDDKMRQQMAKNLIGNVQAIYLLFRE